MRLLTSLILFFGKFFPHWQFGNLERKYTTGKHKNKENHMFLNTSSFQLF